MLADGGALRDVTEAVEVDIRARGDRDRRSRRQRAVSDRALEPGDRQRSGRFEHRPRVLEDVFYRSANLVDLDCDTIVQIAAAESKVSSPTRRTATPSAKIPTCSSSTIRPALSERRIASESHGSTPITLIAGRSALITAAIPEASPPPPIGTKTALSEGGAWRRIFERDCRLAADYVEVVVGRYGRHAGGEFEAAGRGLRVIVAGQVDARTQAAHRFDLDRRRGPRHHDPRIQAKARRRVGDALGVIAG